MTLLSIEGLKLTLIGSSEAQAGFYRTIALESQKVLT